MRGVSRCEAKAGRELSRLAGAKDAESAYELYSRLVSCGGNVELCRHCEASESPGWTISLSELDKAIEAGLGGSVRALRRIDLLPWTVSGAPRSIMNGLIDNAIEAAVSDKWGRFEECRAALFRLLGEPRPIRRKRGEQFCCSSAFVPGGKSLIALCVLCALSRDNGRPRTWRSLGEPDASEPFDSDRLDDDEEDEGLDAHLLSEISNREVFSDDFETATTFGLFLLERGLGVISDSAFRFCTRELSLAESLDGLAPLAWRVFEKNALSELERDPRIAGSAEAWEEWVLETRDHRVVTIPVAVTTERGAPNVEDEERIICSMALTGASRLPSRSDIEA